MLWVTFRGDLIFLMPMIHRTSEVQHTPFAICAQNTAKQLLTAELLQLTWISHSLTDRQVAEHILCDCVVFDFFFLSVMLVRLRNKLDIPLPFLRYSSLLLAAVA